MIVGIPRETCPGETRVAVIPAALGLLQKKGVEVLVEPGAGDASGYPDHAFIDKGAKLVPRGELFQRADVVLQVRSHGSNPEAGRTDLPLLRRGQVVVGMSDPLGEAAAVQALAATGVTAFAMELIPRITRAQSMDVLSSMATIAGYKAVLLGAAALPRMFPMMMTAAGTIKPAKVFVVGAGVAGLSAIATAKRLGAVVEAYDVRPAVKEQVQSLGGRFVELELDTGGAEDKGGYAKAQDEAFYAKQREMMLRVVAATDVVITTAVIPGRKAPILVTAQMVEGMQPGSVVVDLAAERGGNCELTKPGETVVERGVTILGPLNLPATVPYHASQMYAKNITTFLLSLLDKEGKLVLNMGDEVVRETMTAREGEVTNGRVRQLLGLPELPGGGKG